MRIEEDVKLDFSDVLIRPKRSSLESRKDVSLERTLKFKHSGREWTGVPIMNANMGTCGTFEVANVLQKYGCLSTVHKFFSVERWEEEMAKNPELIENLFFPIGMDVDSCTIFNKLYNTFNHLHDSFRFPFIMIDVANGYSEKFVDFVKTIRDKFPSSTIAAGNVATPDMSEALILAGADILKINIGAGSCCTTRLKAGVGYPQLSAVIECADAIHGLGGHLISDGGCTSVADFGKAFGAGADIVMSGSFFAGVDEADAERVEIDGKTYFYNYGMSSKTAQERYGTGMKEYRSSEGRTALVPYAGSTEDVIKDILGGVRSCCTYVGAKSIKELPKRTTFIRVNNTHNTINESNTIGS